MFCSSFHRFLELPWELRRLIWEFALPRSVFTSMQLRSDECVPYPHMSRACREALIIVKEFGTMVTAWNIINVRRYEDILIHWETEDIPWPEDAPNETDMRIRTWFSSKLDTIIHNPFDNMVSNWSKENDQRKFIDIVSIGMSPTTRLVVHSDFRFHPPGYFKKLYQDYLKNRQEILLCIARSRLVFKDSAWGIAAGLNISCLAGNGTQVIHLDDTVTLAKCIKLWEQCCRFEQPFSFTKQYHNFGELLNAAIDENKKAEANRWMRPYKAWVVEAQAFEERLVSSEAYFLLRIVDGIISDHESIRNTGRGYRRRGHEVMDATGRLKEDHPLVRELNIKLPRVIPVCTVSFERQCRCEVGTARSGTVPEPAFG